MFFVLSKQNQSKASNKITNQLIIFFSNDVLEIHYHFVKTNTSWNGPKTNFHYLILHSDPCPKRFGIPKMKLDFQDINWKFRSFGH